LGHGAYNPGDQTAQQQALLAQMQPDLTQNTNALETQLANQGLAPGTQAYELAMRHNGVANNNAILQSITGAAQNAGLQQNIQNSYQNQALSNQNGLNALGGNVTMPTQTGNTGTGTSSAPDIAGMMQSNYQTQVANANANQASKNSILGGAAGLGGTLGGAAIAHSDPRLKQDIKYLSKTHNDLNWYEFSYRSDPSKLFRGVMADEVSDKFPDAVITDKDGFMMVNYELLGLEMEAI
jgi:hypothetical protein